MVEENDFSMPSDLTKTQYLGLNSYLPKDLNDVTLGTRTIFRTSSNFPTNKKGSYTLTSILDTVYGPLSVLKGTLTGSPPFPC